MADGDLELSIDNNGDVRFIHADAAVRLCQDVGKVNITRASHVEPDENGCWWADLAPIGGPKLGPYPPDQRDQALADEAKWIKENEL